MTCSHWWLFLLVTLLPTAAHAQVTFQRTYGGEDYDAAYSVQQTADGGYILAGWTNSFGAGDYHAWLIKNNSLGNVGMEEPRQTLDARRMTLDIRPNPTRGTAVVRTPFASRSSPLALRIFDSSGRLILQSEICNLQAEMALDLGSLPAGVYTLRLGSARTRLVVQR